MTFGRYTLAPGPEWTDLAGTWPVRYVVRMTDTGHWLTDVVHTELTGRPVAQAHLVCAQCEQSVICLHPGTGASAAGYVITDAQIRAGILAHIRERHEDMTPPSGTRPG